MRLTLMPSTLGLAATTSDIAEYISGLQLTPCARTVVFVVSPGHFHSRDAFDVVHKSASLVMAFQASTAPSDSPGADPLAPTG